MDAEKYIQRLKQEQTQIEHSSCLNPKGRDAFELGLIVGMVQAYERMLGIVEEHMEETSGKPRKEPRPVRPVNPYLADLDNAPTLPEQYRRR